MGNHGIIVSALSRQASVMDPSANSAPLSVLLKVIEDPRRAATAAVSSETWEEVKRQAHHHGLSGVLAHLCADYLPADQKPWMRKVVATQLASHHRRLHELKKIAEILNAEGIRFVILKGPVLGERYLNPPFLKVSGDLDLLVDEANLRRAIRCLIAKGWSEELSPTAWWVRRRRDHHIAIKPPPLLPDSATAEIHFRLPGQHAPIRGTDLLDRSALWTGENDLHVRVLHPADEAIFMANHAAGHFFARLAWLYDALMVFRTLSMTDRNRVLVLSRKAGNIKILSAANRAALEFFHEPLLPELPDFPAWLEFRRAAFRYKPIQGEMPWREKWYQRILVRKLSFQLAGSPRNFLGWFNTYLLLPVLDRGWQFLRRIKSALPLP